MNSAATGLEDERLPHRFARGRKDDVTGRGSSSGAMRAALFVLLLSLTGCISTKLRNVGDEAMRQGDHAKALAHYHELSRLHPGAEHEALERQAAEALVGEYAAMVRARLESDDLDGALAVLRGVVQQHWFKKGRRRLDPVLGEAHVALLRRTIEEARAQASSEPWTALRLLSRARRPLQIAWLSLEVPKEMLAAIEAAALPMRDAVERELERELAAKRPDRAFQRAEPLLAWNDRPAVNERVERVRRDAIRMHLERARALQKLELPAAVLLHGRLMLALAGKDAPDVVHAATKPQLAPSFSPEGDCRSLQRVLAEQGGRDAVRFPVEIVVDDCTTRTEEIQVEGWEERFVWRTEERDVWERDRAGRPTVVRRPRSVQVKESVRVYVPYLQATQVLKLRFIVRDASGRTEIGLVEVSKTLKEPAGKGVRKKLETKVRSDVEKEAIRELHAKVPPAWAPFLVANAQRAEAAGDRDAAEEAHARMYLVGMPTEAADVWFERVYGVPRGRLPELLAEQKHSPGDWEKPLALPVPYPLPLLPALETDREQAREQEWKPLDDRDGDRSDFVVSYGLGPHTGMHGVGVGWFTPRDRDAENGVAAGLLAGVGEKAATLGLGLRWRAGYLDGNVAWVKRDGLLDSKNGEFGLSVTGGLELRPVPWLNLKAGLGWASDAFNGLQWDVDHLVYECSVGFVF